MTLVALGVLLAAGGISWALTSGEDPEAPATESTGRTADEAAAVDACVTEVDAADKVAAAAGKGVGHWTEHVQAQTDKVSGKNTEEETAAIWKRTRLAGPGDQKAHGAAVAAFDDVKGACDKVPDEAADADGCMERIDALGPVMASGKKAMGDWASHLKAMADHKAGKFSSAHAQMMWEAASKAAPPNINAHKAAATELDDAPPCP
ncbi:hypothetical protein [Aeromicrobium sp.]|uniref:hypothetical protein n=1 Tax=Aeromicrobium sp. TaxID=1871063 RepID=UPI003D6C2BA8